jgi:hypothetical protein
VLLTQNFFPLLLLYKEVLVIFQLPPKSGDLLVLEGKSVLHVEALGLGRLILGVCLLGGQLLLVQFYLFILSLGPLLPHLLLLIPYLLFQPSYLLLKLQIFNLILFELEYFSI